MLIQFLDFVLHIMSGSVLLHRQLSPEDLQQLLVWYKVRDTLLGQNCVKQDIKKALELACVCEHPNAVWLTKLFGGRDVASREEVGRVFRACENDPNALCFAAMLEWDENEIHQAADLGDAFAQARMAMRTGGEEWFRSAEKSAAQGERDGFLHLGHCYRNGIGCEKDVERAKENFLVAAELGYVDSMAWLGELLDKDDPRRFVWLGQAAARNHPPYPFLNEMSDQIRKFISRGAGNRKAVFAIGRV